MGMGNINQCVHLVGNHMADQHANSANLLIFSNGVQLIPPTAFISPSHTEGKGGRKEEERTEEGLLWLFTRPPQLFLPLSLEAEESNPGDEWGGHKGLR